MSNRSATGSLTVSLQATIQNLLDNTGKAASSQVGSASFTNQTLTNGVSSGQFNRAWENTEISIASGNTLEINLATFVGQDIGGGDGNDALGQAMDLEEIILIAVKNTSTADAGGGGGPLLEVYPAAASGWTPIGSHRASAGAALGAGGGTLIKVSYGEAGFDVIGGTSERIVLEANGGDVTADVVVYGRNDDDESSSSSSESSSSSSSSSVSSSSSSSTFSSSSSSSSSP